MNIKIEHDFHMRLQDNLLEVIEFGNSSGNGLDLLWIVRPNTYMDCAIVNNNHFFFYKDVENSTDYLYATPRCLVDGLLTGSSTLLFELLMRDITPKFFEEFFEACGMYDLINQKLARAIIGCAQRDFKQMQKLSSFKDKEKKLKWATVYTNWLLDYFEVTNKPLDLEGKGLEGTMKEIRDNLHQLRKTVDYDTFDMLTSIVPPPEFIVELWEAEEYYFKAWRESL